jgi:3-oxoacyl-[acyl-carrier-protein] synthase II
MSRRVVITSVGVFSSLGFTLSEIVDNLKHGRVVFERPPFDRTIVSSPIRDFNIRDILGPFKERRYLTRGAQFCVASAMEAIKNAGVSETLLANTGLFVGVGPNLDISGEFPEIRNGNIDRQDLSALWILKFLPNTAASAIAKLTGIHGENFTVTTACSASLQAIGEAFRKIKDGYLDMALAGGGDSRLSHGGILAYKKAHALYTGNSDPEKASRPFDCDRKGFVPGEGGAFFILEEMEYAERRGSKIFGEVCGFGSSLDGYAMTDPDPDGEGGEIAACKALCEAGISPRQIDVVSAHGTGTLLNDVMESNLISRMYGKDGPSVIAPKSWIGHASAACGALELALCLACMHDNYIPAVRNLENPIHPTVNFMREEKHFSYDTVLLENFGFGGQNSVLIVKKMGERGA